MGGKWEWESWPAWRVSDRLVSPTDSCLRPTRPPSDVSPASFCRTRCFLGVSAYNRTKLKDKTSSTTGPTRGTSALPIRLGDTPYP